jgi:biotin carboxyl carrier protein
VDSRTLSLIVEPVDGADADPPADFRPGRPFETTIIPGAAPMSYAVMVGSAAIPVAFNGRGRVGRSGDAHAPAGPQRIVAPMPGKVVRVAVQAGEAVRARQPLVVVEAMKMENELRAVQDGTVAELHAREGMSVEAGALLVLIQ